MNTLRKRYGFYPYLALIILTAAITTRTIACLVAFDFRWGYYTNGLGAASAWIVGIGALLLFSCIFTVSRDAAFVASYTSAATYIPTGILATATFFTAKDLIQNSHLFPKGSATVSSWVAIGAAALGVLAIGYFLLCAIIDERRNISRANYGLFAVVFFCAYAAYLYFDTTLPINAPNKMVDQVAYLLAAIFFLYETRISLGREKWGPYIAFGFVASLLAAYASIPELIIYFAKGEVLANSIFETVLTFALFVFISARVIIAGMIPKDGDSEFVTKLKAAAKKRQDELDAAAAENTEAQSPAEEVEDPDQMSFDIPDTVSDDEPEGDTETTEEDDQ